MANISKIIFSALVMAIIFFSCKQEVQQEVPNNVVSKEQMIDIFADIHIAEAAMYENRFYPDSLKVNKPMLYNQILKSHKLTQEKFDRSYDYWSTEPKVIDDIYEQVIIELTKRESTTK